MKPESGSSRSSAPAAESNERHFHLMLSQKVHRGYLELNVEHVFDANVSPQNHSCNVRRNRRMAVNDNE